MAAPRGEDASATASAPSDAATALLRLTARHLATIMASVLLPLSPAVPGFTTASVSPTHVAAAPLANLAAMAWTTAASCTWGRSTRLLGASSPPGAARNKSFACTWSAPVRVTTAPRGRPGEPAVCSRRTPKVSAPMRLSTVPRT